MPDLHMVLDEAAPAPAEEDDSRRRLIVDINIAHTAWSTWRGEIEIWLRAYLAELEITHGEISLYLTDDNECARYNAQYRGRNGPTNVLSFPATPQQPPLGDTALADISAPILWGDILLAYETIAREAEEQGKDVRAHIAHLLLHGVLHLKGYDHQDEAEAEIMEAQEIAILARLGFSNPYEGTR